jgi:hypothetical protein
MYDFWGKLNVILVVAKVRERFAANEQAAQKFCGENLTSGS